MRLSKKIIDYVIREVAGERAIDLVNYLRNKKNVSEFKIADDLKKDIKEVRTTLYLLVNQNLISSIRKKDKQKGWYIYYWTFNSKNVKYLFMKHKSERLKRLQERAIREKNNVFYICENKCIRFNFDQGINFNFKCPECGELMMQEDNSITIKQIEKEIDNLNKSINKKD